MAALLRGLEVFTGNYLFLFDQGAFYLQAQRMLLAKKPILVSEAHTPIPGFLQGPYYIYFLALPMLLSGNPYWGMVLHFLLGLASIFVGYLLFKRLFGVKMAWLIAFVFALYPTAISASRMIWPPYFSYLLMPFYLYFLLKLLEGDKKYFFWVFLTASLLSTFEIAAGAALYLPVIFYVLLFNRQLVSFRGAVFSFFGAVLPFFPQIVFNFRHENIMVRGIWRFLKGEVEGGTLKMSWPVALISHAEAFRDNFIAFFPEKNWPWAGLTLILAGTVIWMLLKVKLTKKEKHFLIILSLFPVLVFIQLMFYRYILWGWYLIELQVVYIFLIGFILSKLLEGRGKLLAGLMILLLLIQAFSKLHFMYTQEVDDHGGTNKIKAKLEVIDEIFRDAGEQEFNVLVFTPPVYDYAYRYLLNWYGQEKYNYVPGKEKEGLFYLWIEPDPAKPWTYQG